MKLCPRCREPYTQDAAFCPADGAELVREADPLVGRTLAARYRLLRRLGMGGMAVVYLARHVMIERLSAIKILRPDLGMNPAQRERFYREARAVNRINHPNIVEITDFGEDAGLVFLVMEYVHGESLQALVRREHLPWPRAARVAMQIASALARAHELGVVHRDLKPENVLVLHPSPGSRSEEDRIKLTDFGIAKVLDAPAITFTEQRLGTPGFIAPEYIEGAPASPLCDLYALGVVLYEMMTGHLPFSASSPVELMAMTLTAERVPLSAHVADVPPALEDLVMRLIEREPLARPPDAFAVIDALSGLLQKPETSSAPPSSELGTEQRSKTSPGRTETETAARWRGMAADLAHRAEAVSASGARGPKVHRNRDLAEQARGLVASLERVKTSVEQHQTRLDALENRGRAFRASLGNAIDTLWRDRLRERAHVHALDERWATLEGAARGTADRGAREATFWETAALQAEGQRARTRETDLGYQIGQLQAQLDDQNEALEREMAQTSGELEGALAALRHLEGELSRAVNEARSAPV